MFDCPDLDSELLAGIQDLASKPLAELLLQHGILRSMAQENLLRQLREGVSFTREEEPIIIERLWEGVEGEAPSSLAGDWIANLPDPLKLGMGQRWDQVRLQKLMETRYQDRVEPYFLERRKDLEQVVYGLIRLHNQGAAEELYLRLINDGDDFSELAKEHSLGEERFTHGLVGPMLISQPHPTIRAVLESLKVGEVHAPFRVDSWVLLVLLEHRQPARLNDATRIQLLQELLQQEVDETLDPLLATTYESLVPKLGPAPQPTLPPALPPTLVISSDTAALAADQVATITFCFSEAPLGFSLEQISATGGLLRELIATDDPAVFTAIFTPAPDSSGLAEISVAAGSYTNAAGLLGEAAAVAAIPYDTLPPAPPPTLVISSDTAALAADQVATITFSFSEPPLGFSLEQISATGGLLRELVASDDPAVYTALFTPAADSSGLAEISVAAGSYTNAAGLLGEAAILSAIPYDTLPPAPPPTLVISSDTAALAADQVATITFSFSEPPLGFSLEQISATGGLIPELLATDDPAVYVAMFTPAADSRGLAEISVAAGSYTNAAGLLGEAAALAAIPYDTLPPAPPPTLVISSDTAALAADQVATITFGFSEAPLGFSLDQISATGGLLRELVATDDRAVFTAIFSPAADSSGLAEISVAAGSYTNAAGLLGEAANLAAIPYDTLPPAPPPTLVISSDTAALSADQVATITFSFSEPPLGFSLEQISATGGLIPELVATDDPALYTSIFSPAADSCGLAEISVAAGSYTNAAGLPGEAAALSAIPYDTLPPAPPPTLVISSDTAALSADQVATITFSFSEPPLGFSLEQISATGGLIPELVATDDPALYTAIFSPAADSCGLAEISVAAGSYTNAAGLLGEAAALAAIPYDTLPPAPPPTLAIGIDFEVTTIEAGISDGFKANSASLNEQGASNDLGSKFNGDGLTDLIGTPPLGDPADISDARSTVVFFGKASAVSEFAPVADSNDSSLTSVAPSYPTNSLAQSGAAFTLAALTYKTLTPIVYISSDTTSLVAGQVAAMTFGFSEVPIGFTLDSIDSTGGLISNLAVTTDPTVYTAIFTPTPDSSGIAVISVASGFYSNLAGQAGAAAFSADISYNTLTPAISVVPECTTNTAGQNDAASRSPDVSFHTLAPIVFISSNSGRLLAGKVATITFGFSEAPIGFTLDSIHTSGGLISNLEVTTDPTVYTAIFTPTPDSSGIAVISVTAGSYSNLAGQAGGASFSADIPFDTMAIPAGKPPESYNQAA